MASRKDKEYFQMMPFTKTDALIEGAKEFARVVFIAAISAGLTAAMSYATGLDDPLVQLALVTFLTSVGKAWDKFVHKNPETKANGVVPF